MKPPHLFTHGHVTVDRGLNYLAWTGLLSENSYNTKETVYT